MTDVKVCIGTSCHLKGSYNVLMTFQQLMEEYNLYDRVALSGAFCMGNCQHGVSVTVNDALHSVSPESAREFFKKEIAEKA